MTDPAATRYDVFISYAAADRAWVWGWLVPRLKDAGLVICTDRDFAVGAPQVENISRAIDASCHVLLVLSPAWVASEWQNFAGLLARCEDPVGRRRRTIPLLRERCTPPRSIARLTYADFTESDAWGPQFERLIAVLSGDLHRTAFGPPLGALLGLETPTNFIFRQNVHFVGREEELAALHDFLEELTPLGINSALRASQGTPRVAGLTGMGGIGKTQLVVEYIYRYRQAYPGGIFWINAAEPLPQGFARIGQIVCGNGYDKSQRALVQIAADHLRSDPDTLLVLDNLIEPDLLNLPVDGELVPAALPCRVLFTTRRRDLPGLRTITLDALPLPQALQLLLRHPDHQSMLASDQPEYAVAQRLCSALGCLPLAIELAAAFLERSGSKVTLTGYLERLDRYGALATVDGGPEAQAARRRLPTWHDPVAVTLASQWDAMPDEAARLLLQTAALMPEAETIPAARLGLLAGLSDAAEPGFLAPLNQALDTLCSYSLLETLAGDQVRLHPLVREFAEGTIQGRPAFAGLCAGRMAGALWDLGRLQNQTVRRGVDAMLADLRTGLGLCSTDQQSEAYPRLSGLERVLDRQAHHLRGQDMGAQPAFFLQQLRDESFQLGLGELKACTEADLARLGQPYLCERFNACRGSPELVRTLQGHGDSVLAVALSTDGRLAVSASQDKTLKIWEVATGRELRTLTGNFAWVNDVALSADGRLAVSASGSTVKVWDVATGRQLRTLQERGNEVCGIALSADGQVAISATWDVILAPRGILKVWDVATGRQLRTLKGGKCVALSADGRLAVSGAHKVLKVWDVTAGRELHTLKGHSSSVVGVALSSDGRLAISASDDKTLRVWEVATGRELRMLAGHGDRVTSVALSADGQLAISGSADQTLKVWNVATGRELRTIQGGSHVALSADGRLAISTWGDTLKIWNISSALQTPLPDLTGRAGNAGVAAGSEPGALEGQRSRMHCVALSTDGRLAISAAEGCTLKVWEVATGRQLSALKGHKKQVNGVALSANGCLAISASDDKMLKAWDVTTGRSLRTLKGHWSQVTAVALSADGQLAVSGSADHTLKAWDVAKGRKLRTFRGHRNWVLDTALSADGRVAISASWDNTLKVWDVVTGRQRCTLEGHRDAVAHVALSADGRLAISASWWDNNTLRVWDVAAGRQLRTLQGHSSRVNSVSLSADGGLAISASWDNTLRVWDVATGRILSMLLTNAALCCCTMTPDGKTIVAGDSDGEMHFLDWVGRGDIGVSETTSDQETVHHNSLPPADETSTQPTFD